MRHTIARTPIHPGEHLAEELKELVISAAELARQIDVPVNRVTGIINGQRSITADTALRLGHWFGIRCRSTRKQFSPFSSLLDADTLLADFWSDVEGWRR